MNKDYFIYNMKKNKDKLILFGSIQTLILVALIGFTVFKKNNFKSNIEDNIQSKKYVLANNIIDVSDEGKVILYDTSKGKTVDSLNLEGSYLTDMSDDFKELYLLNNSSKELHIISVKNNKLKNEVLNLDIKQSLDNFSSFDYDNGNIVLLKNDYTSFLIKPKDSNEKEIKSNTGYNVNNYKIVKNNLIFTSGEYICSTRLLLSSDNENLKISKKELKLREEANELSTVILTIPSGDEVEIMNHLDNGWYLIKYNDTEGFISDSHLNFTDLSNSSNISKIHIGEKSSYIHEVSDKLFIHNNFGLDRGISILLDINPNTLYINNVHKYDVPTNVFISNIDDTRLYYNEFTIDETIKSQIIKYSYIDDFSENGGYSIESNGILDTSNCYGTLGYLYYKDNNKINIFNIKSNELDLSIDLNGSFFAPIYE